MPNVRLSKEAVKVAGRARLLLPNEYLFTALHGGYTFGYGPCCLSVSAFHAAATDEILA